MEFALLGIGLVLGALVAWAVVSRRAPVPVGPVATVGPDPAMLEAQHQNALLAAHNEAQRALGDLALRESGKRADLEARLAEAEASARALREALESAQQQYRALVEQNRRDQAERELEKQNEAKILQQLEPVAQQLRAVQEKVTEIETQRAQQHGELAAQIRTTLESAAQSKRAAEELASALRSNQARGQWGETRLQTLVETAGLLNRVDFHTQHSGTNDEDARIKPDLVIHLPGGKSLAVDAKAPMDAFMDAQAAGVTPDERHRLMTEHAARVKDHIKALASKKYWTGLEISPEMTVAFLPSEALLSAALDADPGLQEFAYRNNIALTSPSSLFALLKALASAWQQERVTEEAMQLLRDGKDLYARLSKTAEFLAKLGRSLQSSVGAYNDLVGNIEGRVFPTARKFHALDEATAFGVVPQLEGDKASVRQLTAAEFAALEDLARPELDLGLAAPGAVVDAEIIGDSGAA